MIAYHGWGFDRQCWQTWQSFLSTAGGQLHPWDRGYWGQPVQPEFTPSPSSPLRKLLFLHSYGLHCCSLTHWHQADLRVIFSGFAHFHPPTPQARRYSQRVLNQMLGQLQQDPQRVLQQFYSNTYAPQEPQWREPRPGDELQVDRLLQDLEDLNQGYLGEGKQQGVTGGAIVPTLVLHGSHDQIVPLAQGQTLAEQWGQGADFRIIPGAGHALPFTHLQDCWLALQQVLGSQHQ